MGCPRFSVVIPVYNRAHVIRRALDSVLAQDFPDFEVIVVDDGSTDDTPVQLQQGDDPRIRAIKQERSGPAAARNRGASLATGEFLTFLDSDDEVVPHWLSTLDELITGMNADLVSCGFRVVCDGDTQETAPRVVRPKVYGQELAGIEALLVGGTYAVRRPLFDFVGGFSVDQRAGEHRELAFRLLPFLAERGCRTAATPALLLIRHAGGGNRLSRDDRAVFEGGRRLLDIHGDRYARNPVRLAAQASSTGVRAARIGEFGEARRYLWLAARARPLRLKNWARLAAVLVPPVASRLWPRRGSAGQAAFRLRRKA